MLGTLSGFTLMASSLFHLIFGEGRLSDYDPTSIDYYIDTYDITVMFTTGFLILLYHLASLPQFNYWMFSINLLYFIFGLLWTRGIVEDSTVIIESYNVTGILLGVSWFLHFTIISKNKSK